MRSAASQTPRSGHAEQTTAPAEPTEVATQLSFADLGLPLEKVTFVVVDLETTGGTPGLRSITEFGAVKVCGGELVGEFATLVNPHEPISPFITRLTGITTAMVMRAPQIEAVMPSFLEFLGTSPDTVLVAHNARFDVGHLKAAATALDLPWPRVKILDTVKLARRVFTREEAPNVKLGTLARICHATVSPSHRALDDARATVDVLHAMLGRLGPLGVTHLDDLLTASDPVPAKRRRKAVLADGLPHSPGVYRFIGPGEEVMYVGKSVNLYQRVRQYFTAAERRKRMAEMIDLATRVDVTATATALEASVLELRLIAELDPPYNRRSRRPDRRPWLVLTDEPHPRLKVTRNLAANAMPDALGPFSSTSQARKAATLLADVSRLRTCTRVLPGTPRPGAQACHLLELGRCCAPCVSADTAAGERSVRDVKQMLTGASDSLWERQLERLNLLAAQERFEQAAEERDRLAAVLSAQRRRERLFPLLQASEVIAASRSENGWDVAVIRYGRLAGSARASKQENPPDVARHLAEHCEAVSAPATAASAAPVEESELLLAWLWQKETRLLSFTGPVPLALPRRAAARHRVPSAEEDCRFIDGWQPSLVR
ncbi:DEDD exnuclease domain-containing protein [Actinobaculum sp. 352]|nr:DEDD exnuclease domain-containing protein [Actinobaculum sp. 313]RTE48844.1 DEDD exnuclease domain-containing protein [Actinobaculum sp. 352]